MSEASKKAPLTTEEKRRAYAKAYYRKKKAAKAKAKPKTKVKTKVKAKAKAKAKVRAKDNYNAVSVVSLEDSPIGDLIMILLEQVRDMQIQLEKKR